MIIAGPIVWSQCSDVEEQIPRKRNGNTAVLSFVVKSRRNVSREDMGVTGLWGLLEPVSKPVALETLENKILAVGWFLKLLAVDFMQKLIMLIFFHRRCVHLAPSSN